MLVNIEEEIKNEQSRETGNI